MTDVGMYSVIMKGGISGNHASFSYFATYFTSL